MKLDLDMTKKYSESANGGFLYWLIDEKGKSLHAKVQCKDFFTDAMWTEHVGKDSKVCGFEWKAGTINVGEGCWLRMAVMSPVPLRDKAPKLQEFMAEIEEKLRFPRTIVEPYEHDKAYLLLKFSTAWTERPYLISAFTQLVRLGPTYDGSGVVKWLSKLTGNPVCSYDNHRLPAVAERIGRMMQGEVWKEETHAKYTQAQDAHFRGGLVSIKIDQGGKSV